MKAFVVENEESAPAGGEFGLQVFRHQSNAATQNMSLVATSASVLPF